MYQSEMPLPGQIAVLRNNGLEKGTDSIYTVFSHLCGKAHPPRAVLKSILLHTRTFSYWKILPEFQEEIICL